MTKSHTVIYFIIFTSTSKVSWYTCYTTCSKKIFNTISRSIVVSFTFKRILIILVAIVCKICWSGIRVSYCTILIECSISSPATYTIFVKSRSPVTIKPTETLIKTTTIFILIIWKRSYFVKEIRCRNIYFLLSCNVFCATRFCCN